MRAFDAPLDRHTAQLPAYPRANAKAPAHSLQRRGLRQSSAAFPPFFFSTRNGYIPCSLAWRRNARPGRMLLFINSRYGARISSQQGTYLREHHFRGSSRLAVLQRGLLFVTRDFGWIIEAWAAFSNHYHLVVQSPRTASDASTLSDMLSVLHVKTSEWVNRLDGARGRQVWFNFRDTRLTHQKSYLARLNYVHQNAVKHRLVAVANQYPWCSARWFERSCSTAIVKSIYRFKTDKLQIPDDFEPSSDW